MCSATAWFIALENECQTAMLVAAATSGDAEKPVEIDAEAAQFTLVPSKLSDLPLTSR